jgi:iron complex outermembrane receptor protein
VFAAVFCALASALCGAARAQSVQDLQGMSIAQLANIDVTSVSKRTESLSDAPAAVYVITHDEIMRSGATSIPEILRLAPNLQVAEISANSYAITARGFNGNAADKLLVLIDGRSVYTPLFGGVLWDEQDVLPEDIERIEVISGPGATLWGANAVNGVINIITRNSSDTRGGVLELSAGNRENRASLQYSGKINDDLNYRVYVDGFSIASDKVSTGADADDGWSKVQGGFRLDWTPASDNVMLKGDIYHGSEQQPAAPALNMSGGNLELSWQHQLQGGSSLQVLAYYDESQRYSSNFSGYTLETYDLELQHSFSLGDRQKVVWGVGGRIYQDQFDNTGNVVYLPARSVEALADVFAQDTISITRSLNLTLGLKFEKDPYSGVSPLPTARVSWKATDNLLLWAAASRAVRAPTLFDEDLNDTTIPSILILKGNKDFQTEKLTAYEIGARAQMSDKLSLSVSAYDDVYDDLRSVEWLRMTSLPLLWTWGNMMYGDIYGVEAWGDYQATDWWRLSAGFNIQHEALRFKPGASDLNNLGEAGDDSSGQASLRSSMNLGHHLTWNADLRYVGALPNPRVPAYAELDTNLAWAATDRLQFSISGANLLHAHHLEYEEAGATVGDEVERSVSVTSKLRF